MHFICVNTPQKTRRVRRRHELRRRRGRLARAAPDPAHPGGRQVDRPGRHREPAAGAAARAGPGRRRRRAGLEPGVPARGLRRRGHPAPGPDRRRRARPSGPRSCCARSTRRRSPSGVPLRGHRLRHRRAGQGRRQRLPGHQDLLHQRDGRGLRGGRRGRHASWPRRSRLRRRGSADKFLQRRARLRRRLPAQGHPGLHGPRRRAGRRPGADLPARGRLDQHAAPQPDGRAGPRACGGGFLGRRVAVLGAAFKPELRRHPRLARAQRRRPDPAAGRARSPSTTPRRMDNARKIFPSLAYADDRRSRPSRAPTSCCT